MFIYFPYTTHPLAPFPATAGKVKSHFSQRQRAGIAAVVSGAAPHSARCWAMPWRFKRSVRWQLGQKKAMARWSETWDGKDMARMGTGASGEIH